MAEVTFGFTEIDPNMRRDIMNIAEQERNMLTTLFFSFKKEKKAFGTIRNSIEICPSDSLQNCSPSYIRYGIRSTKPLKSSG